MGKLWLQIEISKWDGIITFTGFSMVDKVQLVIWKDSNPWYKQNFDYCDRICVGEVKEALRRCMMIKLLAQMVFWSLKVCRRAKTKYIIL